MRTSILRVWRGSIGVMIAGGLALAAFWLAAGGAPGAAHQSKEAAGLSLTFGMTPEPVVTGQFFDTTWKVTKDGQPVKDLANLSVIVRFAGKEHGPFHVRPAFGAGWGEAGVYHVPMIFSRPGPYAFDLTFERDGKQHAISFDKSVLDAAVITVP